MENTSIIATWGYPPSWLKIRYKIYTKQGEHEHYSFSSLYPLKKTLNAKNTYIIALDTVLASQESGEKCSYEKIVNRAESLVSKYLCELAGLAEIIILPGVITHGQSRFQGKISDYYYLLLYKLYSKLSKNLPNKLVLDLTHGINYMPALTYKAVRELASLLILKKALSKPEDDEMILEVYNSDPVHPEETIRDTCRRSKHDPCREQSTECEPETVIIHQVSKEKITILSLLSSIDEIIDTKINEIPIRPLDKEHAIPKHMLNKFGTALDDSLFILKTFRYGLVPELLSFIKQFKPTNKLLEALTNSIDLWHDGISVKCDMGVLHVTKGRSFNRSFRTLLYAYIIGSTVEEFIEDKRLSLGIVKKLEKAIRKAEVIKTIQDRELSKIMRSVREFKYSCGEWLPLYKVLRRQSEPIEKELFKRNILAHGGWHIELIELKIDCETGEQIGLDNIVYRVRDKVRLKRDGHTIIEEDPWKLLQETF